MTHRDPDLRPPKVDAMLAAAGEAIEDAAIRLIGRDLGTIHRDAIVGAGLAAALRKMADEVDNGPTFPIPPSVVAQLIRERADDLDGAA
jgi:hypothetical protein